MAEPLPPAIEARLDAWPAAVDAAARLRLAAYADLLLEANQRMNLVRVENRDELLERHVLDSLSLLPIVDATPEIDAAGIVDLGSGGGLPGLVLALCRPERKFFLVEATQKKAKFLNEAVAALGAARVRVLARRAEDMGRDRIHRERHPLVMARAVARLTVLLELALPLLRGDGRFVAMKGERAAEEVAEAARALDMLGGAASVEPLSSLFPGRGASLVIVTKTRRIPSLYPRPAGIPERKPLG
jgi:16S rRNA (guanine527-N7)-methyltransferase